MKDRHKEADERLLVEAAQRDPARFGDLYERNFARVYAYVSRRVRSREEAEDVTSEVFEHALASLGSFQWRGTPFAAWLYRIAANALHDRWKRAARAAPEPDREPANESAAAEIERRAMLSELVNTLSRDQQVVIVQRFIEQKSIREIAEQLRRSEGAVKQLQLRALQKLRTRMEGAYE